MDAVVLLTPIFLVGIVALLGFVGGNQIFGLSPTQEAILTTKILASFARVPAGTAQGQVLFHMFPQSPRCGWRIVPSPPPPHSLLQLMTSPEAAWCPGSFSQLRSRLDAAEQGPRPASTGAKNPSVAPRILDFFCAAVGWTQTSTVAKPKQPVATVDGQPSTTRTCLRPLRDNFSRCAIRNTKSREKPWTT